MIQPRALVLACRAARLRTGAAHHIMAAYRTFYSVPLGWATWFVTSVSVAYGAGAVLFWVHAIVRGEAGPAIGDIPHWLLDSTLGLFLLGPAVFVVLPGAQWVVRRVGIRGPGTRAGVFAALAGFSLALLTGPGPLMHNVVAGRESWLGRVAVGLFGHNAAVAARSGQTPGHSVLSEGLLQVSVGVPLYVVAILLSMAIVRIVMARPRFPGLRAGATGHPLEQVIGVSTPVGGAGGPSGDMDGIRIQEREGAVR